MTFLQEHWVSSVLVLCSRWRTAMATSPLKTYDYYNSKAVESLEY